ncbi:hypothetical protein EXU57_12740 [Segetibacter sp. 3557_3]|uniref:hypothetical protein n=1 Tax=Segetibacter sp. 3557_3 TaxID=2547429 RepID=UPI001058EADB|nr:hypothetical protein [Segetibacter sp. 3557_3]TDH25567.1 hypothetical protein EXU57_12740 [Segetibacter sp. 3557_3]
MLERRTISGDADTIFQQVTSDIATNGSQDYHVVLQTDKGNIEMDIVSSPGGNAEGGYEQTNLLAELPANSTFRFAIYPEDVINRIGKLFGMQDVKIGYPEFDDKVIVQTNDQGKLKSLFADQAIRHVFESLSGYSFHIDKHKEQEGDHLHLVIQRVISTPTDLQQIFHAFMHVLGSFSKQNIPEQVHLHNISIPTNGTSSPVENREHGFDQVT